MAQRTEIESHLSALLAVDRFKDYGPNGLQVEGRAEVRRLVSGARRSGPRPANRSAHNP